MSASKEALVAFYTKSRDEITRYRNLEWQVPAYVAALFVFILGLTAPGNVVDTRSGWPLKLAWTAFFIAIVLFGELSLYYIHSSLNRRRDECVKLEVLLGLYDLLPPSEQPALLKPFMNPQHPSAIGSPPRRLSKFVEGQGVFFVFSFMSVIALFGIISTLRLWLKQN